MSEWLFDLGNSRLKFAPVERGGVGRVRAIAHAHGGLAPGWDDALPARFEAAWVAGVATPGLHLALLEGLARRCPRICIARPQPAFAGVRIAYAQPRRFGVDRFLALLAARARTQGPALVVGVGTAMTVDLLDAAGGHRGGRIAPSPSLMRASLHARVPHLPGEGGGYADFAADTADALASGCIGAALGLVRESLAAAAALTGATPVLLLHGGGAEALLAQLPQAVHAPALVLEGVLRWRDAAAAPPDAG